MSATITLSDSAGHVVDFTKTAGITRSGTNPLIIIPIPTGPDAATFGGAVAIDLKMLTMTIDIKFTLMDGVGTHSYTSPTTDYEKLWYMFSQTGAGAKTLYWNGFNFPVVITSLTTPTDPGHLDLMENCSISLTIINPP